MIKFLIPATLAALPACAGLLQPVQKIKLSYGQTSTQVVFEADSPVKKAKPLCECTRISIQGARVIATVDTSTFDRSVEKEIEITTTDGKTTRATMDFDVPQALSLSERSLIWKRGEAATPRVLRIRIPQGSPIHAVTEASLSGADFDYVPAKVRAGKEYTVTVTPKSTAKKALNRLVIHTDSPDPRYARFIVYLQCQ